MLQDAIQQLGDAELREPRVFAPQLVADNIPPDSKAAPVPAVADTRVGQLQVFFGSRPLAPYAAALISAADAYGIDWRLMPVISILESSGGLQSCGGNAWGYAACRVRFATFDEGIQIVAATLARAPYAGRSTAETLCIWVSGKACTNEHGVNYAYKAFAVYSSLGGGLFALPPRPAAQPVVIVQPAQTPTPTPTPTSTAVDPAATPSPSPEPADEPATPTTTAQETATPGATATPEAGPPVTG